MRKRTGLRNRFRSGRSTYSVKRKSAGADRLGTWDRGIRKTPEVINGTSVNYTLAKDLTRKAIS